MCDIYMDTYRKMAYNTAILGKESTFSDARKEYAKWNSEK